MRLRHLFAGSLCAGALLCLHPTASLADDERDKLSVSPGINSTINLSAAMATIDDKSPMATSVNPDISQWAELVPSVKYWIKANGDNKALVDAAIALADQKRLKIAYAGIYEELLKKDLKQQLIDHPLYPGFTGAKVDGIIALLGAIYATKTEKLNDLFNNYALFENIDPQIFQDDTKEVKSLNPQGDGRFVLSRLIARDVIAATNKSLGISLPQVGAFSTQELASELPPDVVGTGFYAGFQIRGGPDATVYAPEVIYSRGREGLDLAAQAYLSNRNGYTGSLRLDVSPGRSRMVHAIAAYRTQIEAAKQKPMVLLVKLLEHQPIEKLANTQQDAKLRTAQMQIALRSSLLFSYRHIDGAGSISSGGLSISNLFPIKSGSTYDGITLLFNSQVLHFDPESEAFTAGLRSNTFVRSGVAVYWQDRVSKVFPDGHGNDFGEIHRWRTQIGVEYNFQNYLQPSDAYGVFLRRRLGNFTDLTLSAGRSGNKHGYIGLSFGKTFY